MSADPQSNTAGAGARSALAPWSAAVWQLASDHYVASWDRTPSDRPRSASRLVPYLDSVEAPAPYLSVAVPTVPGRERVVMALRGPGPGRTCSRFTVRDSDGERIAEGSPSPLDIEALCASLQVGLGQRSRVRLLRWLLFACAATLKLSGLPDFVRACAFLVQQLVPVPKPLGAVVTLGDDLVLTVDPVASDIGAFQALAVLGPRSVTVSRVAPAASGKEHLLIERSLVRIGHSLLFFGDRAVAARSVDHDAHRARSVISWLGQLGPDGPRFVTRVAPSIAAARARAGACAALEEMQLRAPWPRRKAIATGGPIAADVQLAIGRGAGGLFLRGWVDDPHEMVAGWKALSVFGTETPIDPLLEVSARAAAGSVSPADADRDRIERASPFVAYVPVTDDPLASLQYRVEVTLRSGTRIGLVPPLPPASFVDARQAVLTSVPPCALTQEILERCVGPAALSLHARHLRSPRREQILALSPPMRRADVSIVITSAGEQLDLRTPLAVLGTDPQCRAAELIVVLDGPGRSRLSVNALRGLARLHGVAVTLITLGEGFGAAAARNVGARAARGGTFVFLDACALPDRHGWLATLRAALRSRRRLGAVGTKTLSADGAVDQAGLYLQRASNGGWRAHHAFRGLPRGFPSVDDRRVVPAVSAACLMVSKTVFDEAGGFAEDYLCDELVAPDLCLRIRALGLGVEVVPAAELHNVAGEAPPDDARTVATEVDCWHFGQRWCADVEGLLASLVRRGDPTARALALPTGRRHAVRGRGRRTGDASRNHP